MRRWAGWQHHVTLCLLAGAFLLQLQQDWGEKDAQITRPQISRALRVLLPQRVWTEDDLLAWLVGTQDRNERASTRT